MLALHPTLQASIENLSPELVARWLTDALNALSDISRVSTDPVERRRAATTLLRFLTARPPRSTPTQDKPTRDAQNPVRSAPAAPCAAMPIPRNTPPKPDAPPPLTSLYATALIPHAPPLRWCSGRSLHGATAQSLLARAGAPPP